MIMIVIAVATQQHCWLILQNKAQHCHQVYQQDTWSTVCISSNIGGYVKSTISH